MKMGFITAILEDYSFEEVIDFASAHGFSCVELACWPSGKAERRYAGGCAGRGKGALCAGILQKARRGDFVPGVLSEHYGPGSGKARGQHRAPEKTDRSKPQTRCRHGDNLHRSGSDEERGREL